MIPPEYVKYFAEIEKYAAYILLLTTVFGWMIFSYFSSERGNFKSLKAASTVTETKLAEAIWDTVMEAHLQLYPTSDPSNGDQFASPFPPETGLEGNTIKKIIASTKKYAWPTKAKRKLGIIYPAGLFGGLIIFGSSIIGLVLTGFKVPSIWQHRLLYIEAALVFVVFLSIIWFNWIKFRLDYDTDQEGPVNK